MYSICHTMPFSAALWKKHCLGHWFCGKNQIECGLALFVLLLKISTSQWSKWSTHTCFGLREDDMTCSQITASVYKKNCTHFWKVFQCQFNTAFKLKINNLSPIVYNKMSQHSKVRNTAQHLEESSWTKMEMMSFTPEEFLREQNWCP